ncbi:endothelin-converting enzyme 1-like [Centruroides sculpturatus]|uniref:endothelin-converting enzyme 1-like n=1 Tax=Centruroides sculpturatus TaxID=218467 RepID=UPI000C6DE7AD|nr:endothelin-converting enzyme 1-like [Centruroides sculpturatus]
MENSNSEKKPLEEKKCTIWNNRTLLERYLILISLVIFIAFLVMVGVLLNFQNKSQKSKKEVCLNNICKFSAGSILKNMDFTVDPCDDFYEFSCGSYLKYENIYDVEIRRTTNLENYILYLKKEQLEKPENFNDPAFVKKLKKYYQSCLNKPSDMKQVIHGILSAANLDDWPLSENDNSKLTMEEAIALAQSYDSPGYLFGLYRDQNSSYITISRGSDFVKSSVLLNTTEEKWIKLKKKYVNLIDYVLSELDLSTENKNKHIDEIIDFQTSLAKILDKDYNDNSTNTTISELHSNCSQIDWKNMFMVLFEYLQHSEKYNDEFPLEVNSMDFLTDLCELVGNAKNKRIIYNYQVWNIIVRYLPRIHNGFRQLVVDTKESLKLYDKIYDSFSDMNKLKWKTCIQDMELYTELGLDYIMLKSMNRKDDINEVKSYSKQIRETLDEIFSKEDWFDSYSKNIIRTDLKEIGQSIGYENGSLNAEFLNTMFNNINITDNYIQNILAVKKQMMSDDMFDQSVSSYFREEIKIAPMEVGARLRYDEEGIAIEIPLALMYPPFYAYGLPQYLNFGGIAVVIGHEYSHAFDYLDFSIDEPNEMENSTEIYDEILGEINFSEEFVEVYKKKKNCLRFQYSEFPLEGNLTVNGNRTIEDNIADNSGVTVAFRAYEKYLKRHGEEPHLPGLDFTNKQMFFIGFAQLWCQAIESMKESYERDMHSPGKYRVLVPLMNSPDFAEVFNCPLKSFMNPENKCRLWG